MYSKAPFTWIQYISQQSEIAMAWHVTNYELEKQVSENLFDFQLPSVPFFEIKTTPKTCFAL